MKYNDDQVSPTAAAIVPSKSPIFAERTVNSSANKMVEEILHEIKSDQHAVVAVSAAEMKVDTHTLPLENYPNTITVPEGTTFTTSTTQCKLYRPMPQILLIHQSTLPFLLPHRRRRNRPKHG
jgi:hypothetical protein